MTETWKAIAGYEGLYEISDLGRVRSLARVDRSGRRKKERILVQSRNPNGRPIVGLHRDGRGKSNQVSLLVAAAFLGPKTAPCVCHNNGNHLDNRATNLRYDTQRGNCADKRTHGTHQAGERVGTSKVTAADVAEIRRLRTDGELEHVIGAKFGIGQTQVSHIVNRKSWTHIP